MYTTINIFVLSATAAVLLIRRPVYRVRAPIYYYYPCVLVDMYGCQKKRLKIIFLSLLSLSLSLSLSYSLDLPSLPLPLLRISIFSFFTSTRRGTCSVQSRKKIRFKTKGPVTINAGQCAQIGHTLNHS